MKRRQAGQAALEFGLLYTAVIVPLTFMVVYVSQMVWTWHSVVDFTRAGAQFAATHCWQPDGSGSNVVDWMKLHVPPMIDMQQFQTNAAGIQVQYFSQAADGTLTPMTSCTDGGAICEPDAVSVGITSYQFDWLGFSSFLHSTNDSRTWTFPSTTVPMESGGYRDPMSGVCVADATQ